MYNVKCIIEEVREVIEVKEVNDDTLPTA